MSLVSDSTVVVLTSFEAVLDTVRRAERPLYVRFAASQPGSSSRPSIDHASGLTLPGLAVNALCPPAWWRDRPQEDWVRRRIATYAHLQQHHPDRLCWLLHGQVVDRGPDNEPLIIAAEAVGLIAASVVASCVTGQNGTHRAEDSPTTDGAAPWQADSAADSPAVQHRGPPIDWLEQRLVSWSPRSRRRAAVQTLLWSIVLMAINVGLYIAGVLTDSHLILVTLMLSWLAITFTAADLVATTDVREEGDDDDPSAN
jgi:hypothetical protein